MDIKVHDHSEFFQGKKSIRFRCFLLHILREIVIVGDRTMSRWKDGEKLSKKHITSNINTPGENSIHKKKVINKSSPW